MNKEIEISPRQIAKAITDLLNEKEQLEQEIERLNNIEKEHQKINGGLRVENASLHNKIDKAIEELDRVITFCKNDSQGGYDICNMAIRNYKNIKEILKG